jgi:hypothetical protein
MVKKIKAFQVSFLVILLLLGAALLLSAQTQLASAANVNYTLNASADSHSTISPSGNIIVNNGTTQSFTFSAAAGYSISRVLVNGTSISTTSPCTFSDIQANYVIAVSSTANTYFINSTADAQSTITPSGSTSVTYGSSQTYRYTPNTGYTITSVLVDGSAQSISGSYIFTNIIANHTIAVKASIINYTITASADSHSTINPSGSVQVSYGSSQTLNYTANTGYNVSSVLVDGSSTSIVGSYTFSNVQGNHVISVSALAVTPTPSPSPSPSPKPSVTPTPTPQPTGTPTASPSPTPTTTPTSTPAPTQQPTDQPTSSPAPTQAPQPTTTPQQDTPAPTNSPTTPPTPKPTPTLTPRPTSQPTANHTVTPTPYFNPNTISQNQVYPAGAISGAIIVGTVVTALVLKKRQQADDQLDEFEF